MAMKNVFDLLEKTFQQRKSFRSLSLIRAQEEKPRVVAESDVAAASSEYSNIKYELTNQTFGR